MGIKQYGLSTEQARISREKYGANSITEHKRESFLDKLKRNFRDPMIKILCVALLINLIFVFLGQAEWYEAGGIALAVLLATFVSTYSEYNNENAFQKLQEEASRILVKAYRDGEIVELPIDDIVINDCILLQSGDKIPADGLLIEGFLQVDQSALNGEAKEAKKTPAGSSYRDEGGAMDFLNEHKLYRGSVIYAGNGVMMVTTVGDRSVYGQIAAELQMDEERDSPLKVKLKKLAKSISYFGYIGGVAIAVAFLFQRIFLSGVELSAYFSNWMGFLQDMVNALMLAVIIIVMAVPEGLPLMIAIVSALNMGKMLKDNVLVRKVTGIETAGSLNILFSDKTGTITRGKLEAMVFIDGDLNEYQDYENVVGGLGELLALSSCHNTNAILSGAGKNVRVVGGNATERAILSFAQSRAATANVETVHNIPFNSENKYSAEQICGDYDITLIKGAPERILPRCKYHYDKNGVPVLNKKMDALNKKIDELAARTIRVLALATSPKKLSGEALPDGDFTLVGVIGIRDEVRPESIASIAQVQGAGVQVVMITGDRKETAVAIAREAGLLKHENDLVFTSDELYQMDDDTLRSKIPFIRVVARALPSDKSRLVRLAQELSLVVGMTGDGVNDSPALKRADVGFAMGGGTEVAKEAGDIVILDDNFSSIDRAILYGRTIFNSIRKFVVFQLTINAAAVLISFIMPLLSRGNPLTITQILWINLVIDTLAALAFGGEPALRRFMKERPKRRDENIITPNMWSSIITGSLYMCAMSLFFLLSGVVQAAFRPHADNAYFMTGYFCLFLFLAVFNAFNARTDSVNIFDHFSKNRMFLKIMGLIAVVQVLMAYLGGVILHCYGLSAFEWLVVIGLSITIIPVDMARKALKNLGI